MCCACFTGKPDSVFNTAVWIEKFKFGYNPPQRFIVIIEIL